MAMSERVYLSFDSKVHIAGGAKISVRAKATEAFTPLIAFIPKYLQDNFVIENLAINNISQFPMSAADLPGGIFGLDSTGLQFDSVAEGEVILWQVRNINAQAHRFRAAMLGRKL